jgi:hypothetical protein
MISHARARDPRHLSPPVTSGDRKPQVKCGLSPVTRVTANVFRTRARAHTLMYLSDTQ